MNNKTKKGGLGIVSVLTIIFIVLKLLGVIKWSWIWVLSPLWISAVIVLAVFSVILIGGRIKKGKWYLPAFTLTIDDAKKYIYSFSTRRRVYKWADLNVSVWI